MPIIVISILDASVHSRTAYADLQENKEGAQGSGI